MKILKRLLGLDRIRDDVDQALDEVARVSRRQADADRRLQAVEAQVRVVARR